MRQFLFPGRVVESGILKKSAAGIHVV
jgi:hypothetical protein